MKKIISISSFVFQLLSTFIMLLVTYMIFALLDMDDFDMITEVSFFVFQPIMGIILTVLTILVCLILGSPIRFISRLNVWWINKPGLFLIGFTIGMVLLLLSFNSNLTNTETFLSDGEEKTKEVPNTYFAITGWFLIAFNLVHFYPMSLITWIHRRISSRDKSSEMLSV